MAQFHTPLIVENVSDTDADGRGIWRLRQMFVYESDLLGRLVIIEQGFLTDYASVPRAPFAYWLLGDTAHKAAVVHDWLYHHHEVCDERTANRVFLEACAVTRIPAWRRWLLYLGVMLGGRSSWQEDGRSDGHRIVDGRIV